MDAGGSFGARHSGFSSWACHNALDHDEKKKKKMDEYADEYGDGRYLRRRVWDFLLRNAVNYASFRETDVC